MDSHKPDHFKKWMPFACLGVGLLMLVLSQVLAGENGDERVISHLAGSMMFIGGIIVVLVALVTFFLRHNEDIW